MILLVFLCALAQTLAQNQGLEVNTTQGVVLGSAATDGNYFTFFGIHYGGNTAGENRFKAPTPPPNYPGTFHAHDSSVSCAQPGPRGLIGTEDCLTLNIFTNGTTPSKPVLVWLIGDGYSNTDQAVQNFKALVLQGVVVVQMNYRLSIFGFLCLGVPEAPGNAGLKDIVQGLKWIKQNIAAFGGDPNNVILFGHGSGAAMVDLITLSPAAKDLFHKAIAQSGSVLAPWAVAYEPVKYANAIGAQLGYTDKSNAELAQLLANSDMNLLINAVHEIELYNQTVLFAPCIENPNLNDTFLIDAPLNILRSGNYSHVPYIAGYTDKEGTIRAEQAAVKQWLDKMQANFSNFLPADLNFGNNLTGMEKGIRQFYFAEKTIDMEVIEDFLDYQGDTMILVPVIRGAQERASTSQAPVRLYEFAYRGTKNSDWPYTNIPLFGARHGDVLKYLLDVDLRPTLDQSVMNSLIRRYVTFFNTGSPDTSNGLATWLPFRADSSQYLLYSGGETSVQVSTHTETARVNPHSQRITFWNNIYSTSYVLPKPVNAGCHVLAVTLLVLVSQMIVRLL